MIKRTFTLRFDNGETGVLNQLEDGSYACPICGLPWDRFPPYYPNDGELGARLDYSGASIGDVCPECGVEFGVDEGCAPEVPIGFMKRQWAELRTAWLDRVGWPSEALRQIRDNLNISEEQARREAEEVRSSREQGE